MMPDNMENLIRACNEAIEKGCYFRIEVAIEGTPKPEIIINPPENLEEKIKYYMKAYDTNLNHKFSKGIRIVDFRIVN